MCYMCSNRRYIQKQGKIKFHQLLDRRITLFITRTTDLEIMINQKNWKLQQYAVMFALISITFLLCIHAYIMCTIANFMIDNKSMVDTFFKFLETGTQYNGKQMKAKSHILLSISQLDAGNCYYTIYLQSKTLYISKKIQF